MTFSPAFLRPVENTIKNLKRSSGISDTKAGNSVHRSNLSGFSDSCSMDFDTIKKIARKPSIQIE